ncbi:MAG TPA: response regulator [Candidatus Sulfotelmatobacter sp.]|nr:response regulator [Candidatus Sulfotelmatobacter sp.]
MARKILLADDSVTAQNMGRKILADAGYEVITVNNGSAALKKIAEHKPDVIVLDVYMPGYSGLEVCQRLKEAQETSRLPILLTVGKLEPFKPEEAKRVRADGFIVKPFEASELLSALSKLEDKIVPRAETSKPGRFARVTAAIEGRYDKTVAIEEDTGWKDRIAFPPKKKKAEESPADSVASQEETKPAKWGRSKTEEPRIDLGALAPEGLPKDVTPEEIAALAAAAAQVKIAENGGLEPPPVPAWAEQKQQDAAASLSSPISEAVEPAKRVEEKKAEETIAEKVNSHAENANEAALAADSHSDLMAAIAGMESKAKDTSAIIPANEASSQEATQQASEPVTMAAAGADGTRWTAVSVALDPEDAAVSLEQEMQKAYAAFAAVENGFAAGVAASSVAESVTGTATPGASEPAVAESIPAIPAPEAAQSLNELASASADAVQAAVEELKAVAESFVGAAAVPAESAPAPAPQSDAGPDSGSSVGEVAKENPVSEAPQEPAHDPEHMEPKPEAVKSEYEDRQENKKQSVEEVQKIEGAAAASVVSLPQEVTGEAAKDIAVSSAANEASEAQDSARQDSTETSQDSTAVEAAGAKENGAAGKKESDESANTAAAWASWRRIRESGESKESSEKKTEEAMAAAAGAEKSPAEGSAESESDPEAIASIVDSVLADLRPKIFEEISRKMGKKK